MKNRAFSFCYGLLIASILFSQDATSNLSRISIEKDDNFDGYDLIQVTNQRLFVLAEHWHNIRMVPRATMKLLRYLHEVGNVRILAIEQGQSAADLINQYLFSGDTTILKQITRNTMFWGQENRAFFQDLYAFNQTLPLEDQISVQSIDIEYKMESAIFILNQIIGDKEIPELLHPTIGQFYGMFHETKEHREQFDGLAVMFYYDKEFVTQLVRYTLYDIHNQSEVYQEFLGSDFERFAQLIEDMDDGLTFDYTNPNTNYKFRDRLIYRKFIDLLTKYPDRGILCVIGSRHATKGSSIDELNTMPTSPLMDKVMNIRISALFNKSFMSGELRRINFTYPNILKTNSATIIKHDPNDPTLKSRKSFDYTLFMNSDGSLTPFPKVYKSSN